MTQLITENILFKPKLDVPFWEFKPTGDKFVLSNWSKKFLGVTERYLNDVKTNTKSDKYSF